MPKTFLITGGTGLIGSNLVKKLNTLNHKTLILTRNLENKNNTELKKYIKWNLFNWESLVEYVEEADIIIHLAGESIAAKRWTNQQKIILYNSRINSTKSLTKAIEVAKKKPELFLHASAVGYYGFDNSRECDESSEPADDFLANLCIDWENAAADVDKYNIRRVCLRIGVVLSLMGGALPKMILPYKFFVGGTIGSGNQYVPWIHIDDLTNMILFSVDNNVSGVFNAVSPDIVTMKEFSSVLAKILSRPNLFKVPEFILNILLGESAKIVTGGQKVIPKRILETSFKFKYAKLETALHQLIHNFELS